MSLNAGKCHFTCRGKNMENETFIFKDAIMKTEIGKNTRCYYRQQTDI